MCLKCFARLGFLPLIWVAAMLFSAQVAQGLDFVDRRDLGDGLAEYSFELRVGVGEYDVIGLHRVVRERRPGVPVRGLPGVFMVHGDVWDFNAAFFSGSDAIVPFLARNGIDVWGIDLRWTRVPATETDFSFMEDWGIEANAHEVGLGLLAARTVRAITGSGAGRLFLLGWSRGGMIGYAYLNQETQWPWWLRQVRGFVPVDIFFKTDDAGLAADACFRRDITQASFDAGVFNDATGQLVELIGTLAEQDPAGASPVFPGVTNRQGSLLLGAATFSIFPGGLPPVPAYHFTGGTFDATGLPSGLIYTAETDWTAFLKTGSPFEPTKLLLDSEKVICDLDEVSFDDHLSEINVPVLYVGAGGGFGEFGVFATTLLGSTDVTSFVVSLASPQDRLIDFGHGDLFLAMQAQDLVWQPILDWIQSR